MSFGTAVYTNGLLVGETIPVMLTLPLVFPLVDDSWRWGSRDLGHSAGRHRVVTRALGAAGRGGRRACERRAKLVAELAQPADLATRHHVRLRQLRLLLHQRISARLSHRRAGRPDLISGALTALNFGQLPASFIMLAFARQMERKVWPFVTAGVVVLICLAGIVMTASLWTLLFAGILGFTGAVILTLGFALPALLSAPADVARMSAAMFTISYSEGLVIAVLSGAAWDLGGSPRFAFLPMAIALTPLLILPATIRFHRPRGAAAA